tara:strand:+ start:364 stop:699 length:336 start_codon:yes stop_codon:yes gene_type:complete
MELISYQDFLKINICIGTILTAVESNNLKNPSIILTIDFGKFGIKKSSAQLRAHYNCQDLLNKQIAAVINFPPKQIGNFISEVLVLGFPDNNNEPVLIAPEFKIENGKKLY